MFLSYWEKDQYFENVDFCIVGAGIVGSFTALHIKKALPDARILILERGSLPFGASTKNAGFACFGSVTEMEDDLQSIDENQLIDIIQMRVQGLELLKQTVPAEQMDFQNCGGYEVFMPEEKLVAKERIEFYNELVKKATGLEETFRIEKDKFGTGFKKDFIFNQYEGKLHPVKMLTYLHRLLSDQGIRFLFGSTVQNIENDTLSFTDAGGYTHDLKCDKTILCTNAFSTTFIKEDIVPARNIVMVSERIPNLKLSGTFHLDKGYVYFRNIGDRILLGGARNIDANTETTQEFAANQKVISRLKEIAEMIYPDNKLNFEYTWAGIIATGNSKLPIIKQINDHLWAGVRLGGMGVAIGSLVGRKLAEKCTSTIFHSQ